MNNSIIYNKTCSSSLLCNSPWQLIARVVGIQFHCVRQVNSLTLRQFIARVVGTRFVASVEESHTSDMPQIASVEESPMPDTPQPEAPQATEESQPALVASGKKHGKKKGRLVSVEEIMPKPSYWPLALAASFVVLCVGIIISWIVIAVGAILMIVCIMGWALERR
jgi:hypothetical protein